MYISWFVGAKKGVVRTTKICVLSQKLPCSAVVHSSLTSFFTKARTVSLSLIEIKLEQKKAKGVLLILDHSELDMVKSNQEVENINQCRGISYNVLKKCQIK